MINDAIEHPTTAKTDGIEHVVLLMMENHSFDQMLGSLQGVFSELDGVTPELAATRSNATLEGKLVFQHETRERQMAFDPKHEHVNVMAQLDGGNSGFVREFQKAYSGASPSDLQDVMGYYPLNFLPALHSLGSNFTVCDNWFASMPGPTWPNRFFALSGTCSGQLRMPEGAEAVQTHWYTEQQQETVFTRLTQCGRTWRVYHYDFPCSLILKLQREPASLQNYVGIDQFFEDVAGDEQAFPAFTFVEPQYFGVGQNDDHPPHNVMKAEKLIADVYNAIHSNLALWSKTLLVVMYDEHGGFYDHIPPPDCTPPDASTSEWPFNRLGVRVPALLISPRCGRRVEHTRFDHTSLLKYMQEKWDLGALGKRTAAAKSIGCAIGTVSTSRLDALPFIRVPNSALISDDVEAEKNATNNNQQALHHFAEFLHRQVDHGLEEAVNLAADVATIANWWVRTKHWLGQRGIKLGMRLSRDMRHAQDQRQLRTRDALAKLRSGGGR